jgi:hypothetical protein
MVIGQIYLILFTFRNPEGKIVAEVASPDKSGSQ